MLFTLLPCAHTTLTGALLLLPALLCSRLATAAARLGAEYDQRCAAYAEAKADAEARQAARREEVRSIVEAAAAVPEGE
jgi:hypothetical protein